MSKYYVAKNGQQSGPFDIEEVISLLGSATLTLTDYIFDEKYYDWVLLMAHNDVKNYLESRKPNLPPPASLVNPVKVEAPVAERVEVPEVNESNLQSNLANSEYKKNLIDEVRNELSNTDEISSFSNENISGPVTPSHFDDLIEGSAGNSFEEEFDIDDKTTDIPVQIDDSTLEVDIGAVEQADKAEQKIMEGLKAYKEKNNVDLKDSVAQVSKKIEQKVEVPEVFSSGEASEVKGEAKGIEQKPASVVEPIQELVAEKKRVTADKPVKAAFKEVSDNVYQKKVNEIKSGGGSLKEKALKISMALEEASDPLLSEWFVLKDHNKYGPYTYKDMLNLIDEKFIFGFDFVWHSSLSNWRRLGNLEAFQQETINKLKNTYMPELTKAYHKRRHKRVNFGHSIVIHDNNKVWKGKSVQISERGVGVVMEQAHITKGQTLYLHFKPGDGVPPFNATCEVISKKPQQNSETNKLEVLYGMIFLNISNDVGTLVSSISKNNKVG